MRICLGVGIVILLVVIIVPAGMDTFVLFLQRPLTSILTFIVVVATNKS